MTLAHNKRRAEEDSYYLRPLPSSISCPTTTAKKQRTPESPRSRSPSPTSVGRLSYPHKPYFNSFSIPTDAISIIVSFVSYVPKDTRRYASVSKSFNEASRHNIIWKFHCHRRWATKWGFDQRWNRSLEAYEAYQHNNSATTEVNDASKADNGQFWYQRYVAEEKDSKRSHILLEELTNLQFDCRSWFHPHHLPSSLYINRSKELRYSGLRCSNGIVHFIKLPSGDTHLSGHRKCNPIKGWHLEDASGKCIVSFGSLYDGTINLCNTFFVRRLDNWGWEIASNYQVMRAIDKRLYSKSDAQRASRGIDNDSLLWSSYLKCLTFEDRPANTKATRKPIDNLYIRREVPNIKEIRDFLVW